MAGPPRGPFDHVIEQRPTANYVPAARPRAEAIPPELMGLPPDLAARVVGGVNRSTGKFSTVPFIAQTAGALIIPEQHTRFYFFILNQSAANRIFVGFDGPPNAGNGVTLEVSLGFWEPWVVPINAIWVAAAGANTQGIAVVATVPI